MADMGYSLSDLRAAVGGDGFGDGFGGNSGIWLILLFFLFGGRNGWGNTISEVAARAATEDSVKTVQNTLDTNTILDAIRGNRDAITSLAQSMNMEFNRVSECCCATQRLIEQVGNATNLSIKDLSANIILQSKELSALIQNCCCETRTMMLQGFNGVDKSLCSLNTNMLQGFSAVNTSVERGFASTAFETQKQTCDIIKNQDANTDKIIAWLNANKQSELEEKLSLARVEISQRNQTDAIFERLRNARNGCGCGCNDGCNICGF